MSHDPLVGRSFGNVRLIARLGAGAMGVVYRGFHERVATEVAVKILHASANDKQRERFLREGRAAAKVKHEYVVQVFDAGEVDHTAYLVLELVNGHSLGRILDEQQKLPADAVARLGAQIALGLAAIHAKGIVHRDVKPDNIMLAADGTPKIADLGLAKQLDDPELIKLTGTGMVVGTPLYVSPEAIRDPKSIGTAADVYSLGVTLYHMLAGQPPFNQNTPYEVMRAHLEDRPPSLEALAKQAPRNLITLIERCLAKDPARRPSAEDLARLLASGSAPRAILPRWWPLALVAVVVAALAAGVVWLLHHAALVPAPTSASATGRWEPICPRPMLASVAGGPWDPVPAEGLNLALGTHEIRLRSAGTGAWWEWQGTAIATAQGPTKLSIEPARRAITPVTVSLPGSGMIFVDGIAYGLDAGVRLAFAGSYAVARAQGGLWQAQIITIDAGAPQISAVSTHDHPDGSWFWRTVDDDGQILPSHHLTCWWEVEQAREAAALTPTGTWQALAVTPEQPAIRVGPAMLEAYVKRLGPTIARLPTRPEAVRLGGLLRAPLWCRDQGRLDVIGGGSPGNALVVVVPP